MKNLSVKCGTNLASEINRRWRRTSARAGGLNAKLNSHCMLGKMDEKFVSQCDSNLASEINRRWRRTSASAGGLNAELNSHCILGKMDEKFVSQMRHQFSVGNQPALETYFGKSRWIECGVKFSLHFRLNRIRCLNQN